MLHPDADLADAVLNEDAPTYVHAQGIYKIPFYHLDRDRNCPVWIKTESGAR